MGRRKALTVDGASVHREGFTSGGCLAASAVDLVDERVDGLRLRCDHVSGKRLPELVSATGGSSEAIAQERWPPRRRLVEHRFDGQSLAVEVVAADIGEWAVNGSGALPSLATKLRPHRGVRVEELGHLAGYGDLRSWEVDVGLRAAGPAGFLFVLAGLGVLHLTVHGGLVIVLLPVPNADGEAVGEVEGSSCVTDQS